MSTDTIAVIGPQSSVVAHLVSHVTNAFQVPLLSFAATDSSLSPIQFPFFVRTTQSDLYQMTAIAKIIEYYDWKQVVAIFIDDDYGRNGVANPDDALAVSHIKISHKVRIPPSSEVSRGEIMNILVKVALLESRIFVLHTYPDSGFMVFSVAHYLGMLGDGYAWIATD
ncbi:Glutamate receptor 3.3 [Camellia lanceoleosa]|uniref:Glutamate receptor 3.3 n=1 Tax=Camellia lanceoleosa TaxID=1840588 RepID=A0ACC0FG36_9ERIC|nr:Glutamate receptor 3.3 [Camellia lanceoleosa]